MNIRTRTGKIVIALLDNIHERRRLILALSCAVVFITTYVLILPAFTLEKDEAAEQGGIDVPAAEQSADAVHDAGANSDESADADSGEVSAGKQESADTGPPAPITIQNDDSKDYSVAVEGDNATLSEGMSINVREIDQSTGKLKKEYDELYFGALEAVQKEEGSDKPSSFAFAKFYDISLMDGKKEVEPDSVVDVKISFGKDLQKELKVADTDRVYIVHFAVDKNTGEVNPEVLDTDSTAISVENSKLTEATFTTDSFSVFAVVYTVDFHYNVDGKEYDFSIPGGEKTKLSSLVKELGILEGSGFNTADQFVKEVKSVEFSNSSLVKVSQSGDDWELESLRPFDTNETLQITMKDGEVLIVQVTDANDAGSSLDQKVITISYKSHAMLANVNNNQLTTGSTSDSNSQWKFIYDTYAGGYRLQSVGGKYIYVNNGNNSGNVSLVDNANDATVFFVQQGGDGYKLEVQNTGNWFLDYKDNQTFAGSWSGNNNIESLIFEEIGAQSSFPVTLHFVKEDGTSFEAGEVTYADGTPIAYEGGNFVIDPSKVDDEDGIIELSQFQIKGYTLSNTHRDTPEDLLGGVSKPSHGANAQQPHSIIGNQLKWTDSSKKKLQYRSYYTNSDKAGHTWIDVGYRPGISDYNATGHPGTSVKDDIYDYYLVYSPLPTESSSGGESGSPIGNLESVGKSKTLTPNEDGTYTMDLSVTTHAKGGEQSNGLNLIIVVDTSSSMISNSPTYNNQTKTRLDWTKPAVQDFVKGLNENNNTDPNKVQFALIDFNLEAKEHKFNGSYWTNDGSENGVFNKEVGKLTTESGTNWAQALEKVRTIYSAEETDDDPTYVLFLTDGAPSQYWDPEGIDKFYVDGEGCYLGARDEARAVVNDGMILYGIFAFGSGDTVNPAPGTDKYNDYLGKLVDYAYNDDVRKTYRQYADDPAQLRETLNNVFTVLKQKVAHTGVNYNDGIALDTTSTALSANVSGSIGGITYTKTGGNGKPYTVVADSDGNAKFIIDGGDPIAGTKETITYKKISGSSDEEGGITVVDATATVYKCTVGSGDNAVTYYMPIATLDIDPDSKVGDLNWDLSPLGFLEEGANYKISFVVWPDQEAYDYVADLNNGKASWDKTKQKAVYAADGETFLYYKNGVTKYPNIVYYPDTDTYAALTNTKQEVTYYVGSESTSTSGAETNYDGQYKTYPETPDPMPLTASQSSIEKQWIVDRDPEILGHLLYGTETRYTITFDVLQDNKQYAQVTLGWDGEKYVWDPESVIEYKYEDDEGNKYDIGTRWVEDFAIATGLMLSETRMDELKLDKTKYLSGTFKNKKYYILEQGHDYTIKEHDVGFEFDFNSPLYHPMLVDGKLQSVNFTKPDEGVSITEPEDEVTITSMTFAEKGLSSMKVDNTLRGYINLRKIVLDKDEQPLDTDTEFEFKVKLTNSNTRGLFQGDHIPWYGIDGLFYHDEAGNYYQAAVKNGKLTFRDEKGNTYDDAVCESGFNASEIGPQTIKYDNGSKSATIFGNRMTANSAGTEAEATLKITNKQVLNIANVPAGTHYTITETYRQDYGVWDIDRDIIADGEESDKPYEISIPDRMITGEIVPNADNEIAFTNKAVVCDLKIKKQVTIQSFSPDDPSVQDKTVADGTYVINIAGKDGTPTEGKSYTAKITISNGEAVSATLKDNTLENASDVVVDLDENGALVIHDMVPGEYTVTEEDDHKTALSAATCSGDADANTDLPNRTITIHVNPDAEEVQLVTMTNNYEDSTSEDIAHVSVRKTFEGIDNGNDLPKNFNITLKVTATIDGKQKVFNYTLKGEVDPDNGITWNQSHDDAGNVVWNWRVAIRGLQPDAVVEVQEVNYSKPGFEVITSVNPANDGGDGTSYTGTVSNDTIIESYHVDEVITRKNQSVFPLYDTGGQAKIFIARLNGQHGNEKYPLIITRKQLSLSERAYLEDKLRTEPFSNAEYWLGDAPNKPLYYSVDQAEGGQLVIRGQRVVYSEEEGDPTSGKITFLDQRQWTMVAETSLYYKEGRPADFNFRNRYQVLPIDIDVIKVDNDDTSKKLGGAVFKLRKLTEKDGAAPTPTASGTFDGTEMDPPDPPATADGTGKTTFKSLTPGYYELTEINAPAGYVIIEDKPIYFHIKDGAVTWIEWSEDQEKWIEKENNSDDLTVSFAQAQEANPDESIEAKNAAITISNEPGPELPHTGGIGTTIFYILGSILVIGGGIYFVSRRRMK